MFRKIVLVGMVIFSTFLYGKTNTSAQQNFITINKKMIEGKIFYSRFDGNSFYIQAKFKKIDPVESFGEVAYTMMDSPRSISGNVEYVSYWLKKGKIVIYGNDGSATRLTLISATPDRWILIEEGDVDGIDKQFGFKKRGKETWYLKKPRGYPQFDRCIPEEMECHFR